MADRPSFIVSTSDVPEKLGQYPDSSEELGHKRAIGKAAGLLRQGLHVIRLEPGHRSSWPHAEELEEEWVFVLEGTLSAWVDGNVFPVKKGDLVAFPAGTGITHVMINDSGATALLLVGGEANKDDNRITYPFNPERRAQMKPGEWWDGAPRHPMGPHDGRPKPRAEK